MNIIQVVGFCFLSLIFVLFFVCIIWEHQMHKAKMRMQEQTRGRLIEFPPDAHHR